MADRKQRSTGSKRGNKRRPPNRKERETIEEKRRKADEAQKKFEEQAMEVMTFDTKTYEQRYQRKKGEHKKTDDYWQKKTDAIMWILKGNSVRDACAIAGISKQTFYDWKKKFPDFSDDLKRAMLLNKAMRLERIRQAGYINWQADAWYLERMWSDEFSMKHLIDVEGGSEDPADTLMRKMFHAAVRLGGKRKPEDIENEMSEDDGPVSDIPRHL